MHANIRQGVIDEEWTRYLVGISQTNIYTLGKQVGKDFQTLAEIDFDLKEGWHTMEIRSYDNLINVYIDDQVLAEYKDTDNPISSGKLGFEVHTGGVPELVTEYLIDDVEIKVISSGDVSSP